MRLEHPRNLYLTMQLLEMDIPMVIALNMMDEMTGNSGSVDVNGMEAMLGVPAVSYTHLDVYKRQVLHLMGIRQSGRAKYAG